MVSKGSLLALLVFLGLGVPRTLVLETRIWPIRVIVAEQVCNKSQDKHFPLYLQGLPYSKYFYRIVLGRSWSGANGWDVEEAC